MTWESIASAAAWEVAETAAALELELASAAAWEQLERRAGHELGSLAPSCQLALFGAPAPSEAVPAPAINEFEGPCVVCGEPGRRRQTFPAAFAASMPPPEPTCRGHELVAVWDIPLTAAEATQLFSAGDIGRRPTFRYREVRGVTQKKKKATTDA